MSATRSPLRRVFRHVRRVPVVGPVARDVFAQQERILWGKVITPIRNSRVRPALWRSRAAMRSGAHRVATRMGAELAAGARALLLVPHRADVVGEPPALRVAGREFDVVDDLVGYSGLSRARVVELVRRRHETFRTEWHSFPATLRDDHWFYLSSRTYLFSNAIHLHGQDDVVEQLIAQVPGGGSALDFGGGTGNLALALAAAGRRVAYTELSAIQKDFVRFRTARHGLASQVSFVDWWDDLPADSFDVVFALDVFEHLPDLESVLVERLLPSLRAGGALVEASPFIRSLSNPMHYEDGEILDRTLAARGFGIEESRGGIRRWRASA